MFSKSLAVGALAAGCIAAAAGGAYMAVRHNAAEPPVVATAPATPGTQAVEAPRPVSETEAVVTPEAEPQKPAGQPTEVAAPVAPERAAPSTTAKAERESPRVSTAPRVRPPATSQPTRAGRERPVDRPAAVQTRESRDVSETPGATTASSPVRSETPEAAPRPEPPPPAPQFEELVVPASSVIGLRVETALSTERARIEDRVNARVTRDVMADGHVAIPAGAQAIGTVTLVERGGKIKERARLGVRFHTLVLADGRELPISTEAIYREGEAPSGESARKIGGAAVGGAILGALIGGKKGAMVGGATGAAGGTAVVMAGDRNAATLPTGTIVTIRLAAPVGVEVEKR